MLLRTSATGRCANVVSAVAHRRARLSVRAAAAAEPSTRVRYAKRPTKKDLFYYTIPPPEDVGTITNLEPDDIAVELQDLRADNGMQWQRNGFELVQFPAAQDICWEDKDQV